MKKLHNKFSDDRFFFVIGFLVLGIIGVGVYFVVRFVVDVITGMDDEIARIFDAGLVFALLATLIISFAVWWGQRRLRVNRLRENGVRLGYLKRG